MKLSQSAEFNWSSFEAWNLLKLSQSAEMYSSFLSKKWNFTKPLEAWILLELSQSVELSKRGNVDLLDIFKAWNFTEAFQSVDYIGALSYRGI